MVNVCQEDRMLIFRFPSKIIKLKLRRIKFKEEKRLYRVPSFSFTGIQGLARRKPGLLSVSLPGTLYIAHCKT